MIKPVNNVSNTASINKRQKMDQKNKKRAVHTRSRIEDKVDLSPEGLTALEISKLVRQVKDLPDVNEERVDLAQQKMKQANFFELAADNISEQISSLFIGNGIK